MKIAFFGKSHNRSAITSHIVRGLRKLGHDVLWINRHKLKRFMGLSLARWWIRRRIQFYKPDLILIFTRDLELPLLEEFSKIYPTAQFYDDCNVPLRDEVVEMARLVGHFFITSRGQVKTYADKEVDPVTYVTGGCDPVDHKRVPVKPEFVSDVAFIGSAGPKGSQGQKDRIELMTRLNEHFDLKVYGRGWKEHGIQTARDNVFPQQYRTICASSKIMIGLDLRNDVDLYFSNRTWITMGCGGLLLTRYVPNLEEVLEHGKTMFYWRDFDDCVENAKKILALSPEEQEQIRQSGFDYAHQNYSYQRMAERMLDAIKERGAGPKAKVISVSSP